MPKKIYVSYAWGDDTEAGRFREQVVDELCEALRGKGIDIIRDKECLKPGDSISKFMRELSKGDHVVAILSERYLRSPNCMRELYGAYLQCAHEKRRFTERLIAITLDAKIDRDEDRLDYAKHWKKKANEITERIQDHPDLVGSDAPGKLKNISEFAQHTSDMLEHLSDVVMPRDIDRLRSEGFTEICAVLGVTTSDEDSESDPTGGLPFKELLPLVEALLQATPEQHTQRFEPYLSAARDGEHADLCALVGDICLTLADITESTQRARFAKPAELLIYTACKVLLETAELRSVVTELEGDDGEVTAVPVQTSLLLEVLMGWAQGAVRPRWIAGTDESCGEALLRLENLGDQLETGITEEAALGAFLSLLWKKLFPSEPPYRPLRDRRHLFGRLKARKRTKQRVYVGLDSGAGSKHASLAREVREIKFVERGSEASSLGLDEFELADLILTFLKEKPTA